MRRPAWATGFGGFLLALCCLLLAQPFVAHYHLNTAVFEVVYSLTLVTGAVSTARRSGERLALWTVVVIAVPVRWAGFTTDQDFIVELGRFAGIAFFLMAAFVMLRDILSKVDVTVDTLYGAVAVYLLVALGFSLVFQSLARNVPGAFLVHGEPWGGAEHQDPAMFTYYSLVTITTLGYGDIVPVDGFARTFSVFEAVTGQLYVALLLGRLLGLHLQGRQQKSS